MKKSVLVAIGLTAGMLLAQAPGIQRTVVKQQDVSVPGREAVVAKVEIAPGGGTGRHTHPGEEITYVIDGEIELLIDGQPLAKYKGGEAFVVPNGVKHDARNTTQTPAHLSAVYLVEKGKPLATPAP